MRKDTITEKHIHSASLTSWDVKLFGIELRGTGRSTDEERRKKFLAQLEVGLFFFFGGGVGGKFFFFGLGGGGEDFFLGVEWGEKLGLGALYLVLSLFSKLKSKPKIGKKTSLFQLTMEDLVLSLKL